MRAIPVVHVAHPLSAPTRDGIEENRAAASKWAAWIATTFRVAVECSWIVTTGELAETPENRAFGLEMDCALVRRCDVLVMVGPRVSEGMRRESEHARAVVDWTWLSPPRAVALAMIDGLAIARLRHELFAAIEGVA